MADATSGLPFGPLKTSSLAPLPPASENRWTRNDASHWREEELTDLMHMCKTLNHIRMACISIRYIVSPYHFIIGGASAALTILCTRHGILYDVTWSVVSFAIVFPMVFAISTATHRREAALMQFANVRTGIYCIFLGVKDFSFGRAEKIAAGLDHNDLCRHARAELYELVDLIVEFFKTKNKTNTEQLDDIYAQLARISALLEATRPAIETGMLSRVQQYVYHTHTAFERMRLFKEYGTPYAVRTIMYISILLFPLLYAPYFAKLGDTLGLGYALTLSTCASFLLCSLLCIVDGMEAIFEESGKAGDYISVRLPMAQLKAGMRCSCDEAPRSRPARAKQPDTCCMGGI